MGVFVGRKTQTRTEAVEIYSLFLGVLSLLLFPVLLFGNGFRFRFGCFRFGRFRFGRFRFRLTLSSPFPLARACLRILQCGISEV